MRKSAFGMKKLGGGHRKGVQSLLAPQCSSTEPCKAPSEDEDDNYQQTSIGPDIRREIEARFNRSDSNACYVFPRVAESALAHTALQAEPRREMSASRSAVRIKPGLRPKTPMQVQAFLRPLPRRKHPTNLSFFQLTTSKSRPLVRKVPIKANFGRKTIVPSQTQSSFRRKSNLSTTITDSQSTSFAVDYLDTSNTSSSASQYLLTINKFLM